MITLSGLNSLLDISVISEINKFGSITGEMWNTGETEEQGKDDIPKNMKYLGWLLLCIQF